MLYHNTATLLNVQKMSLSNLSSKLIKITDLGKRDLNKNVLD